VLAIMRRTGKPLSELVAGFERVPQVLVNVNVANKRPVEELPEFQRQLRASRRRSAATAACSCATAAPSRRRA
jgi:phosphoglucosamine mutase